MAFDFVEGLDCDPIELDRRLKQAEDNPPGPGPVPPEPTPGVDFDYSTTPVITTALPHWGADFQDVPENSIVMKDNGIFVNLGIAITSRLKLFVRAWCPKSPYGYKARGQFSGISMLYFGDSSCNFSNNGDLPVQDWYDGSINGKIDVPGYTDMMKACVKGPFYDNNKRIVITQFINTGSPLQNAKTNLLKYTFTGVFYDEWFDYDWDTGQEVFYPSYIQFSVTTEVVNYGGGSSVLENSQPQKVLEFGEGFFSWLSNIYNFSPDKQFNAYYTDIITIPFSPRCLGDTPIYKFGWSAGSNLNYTLQPMEPIFQADKDLQTTQPTIYHTEGVEVPLNNFCKYNAYSWCNLQPRHRVAAGQSFKPGYVAENLPAEWNAM